jgi:hypothetical protein
MILSIATFPIIVGEVAGSYKYKNIVLLYLQALVGHLLVLKIIPVAFENAKCIICNTPTAPSESMTYIHPGSSYTHPIIP